MIVEIKQFVEHRDRSFELRPDAVTLIHGPSGFGKSTLLQSIPWVLYGGPTGGKKYDVTIRHDGIVVRRYSKPDTLIVTMPDGMTQTGDLAREQIKQLFGDQDIFEACCFLRQGHILLMTRSSKELLFYLSKITFRGEEDPMILINALKKRIVREEAKYKEQLAIYDASLDRYEAKKLKRPIEKEASHTTIEAAKERLTTIDKDLLDLHRRIWEYEKLKERQQHLHQERDTLKPRLNSLTNQIAELQTKDGADRLSLLEEKRNVEERISKYRQELQQEKATLDDLQALIGQRARFVAAERSWAEKEQIRTRILAEGLNIVSFTQNDLYALQRQWEDYNTFQRLCTTFSIEATTDSLQKIRLEATNALTYHSLAERHRTYLKLKNDYTKLKEYDLKQITSELQQAKLYLESLQCPHCAGQVRYENGRLVALKPQSDTIMTKEKVKMMENQLGIAQKQMAERERLNIQLETYKDVDNFVPRETMSKDRAEAIIRSFRNLKYVEKPQQSLDQGKLLLSYHTHKATPPIHIEHEKISHSFEELEEKMKAQSNRLKAVETSLNNEHAKLSDIQRRIAIHERLISLQQQEESLRLLLTNQTREIEEISKALSIDPKNDLKDLQEAKLSAQRFLDDVTYAIVMAEERVELRRLYDSVNGLKIEYNNSSLLYRYLTRKYYKRLINTIDRLNRDIQTLIRDLFVYPMSVRFVAELVSSKTDYNISVSLEVIRKGTEARINRDNEISSGERERIAITLMIALAKFHRSPIVLLDEAMARIDANDRDLCIDLLKRSLPHRIIVCVEHHADEGMYDHHIPIRPMKEIAMTKTLSNNNTNTTIDINTAINTNTNTEILSNNNTTTTTNTTTAPNTNTKTHIETETKMGNKTQKKTTNA